MSSARDTRGSNVYAPLVEVVAGINFNQDAFSPGDKVLVTILLTESLRESQTDHINFGSESLPFGTPLREIPEYGPIQPLASLGDSRYGFEFVIPTGTKTGIVMAIHQYKSLLLH